MVVNPLMVRYVQVVAVAVYGNGGVKDGKMAGQGANMRSLLHMAEFDE
jgi:hypothetical protein